MPRLLATVLVATSCAVTGLDAARQSVPSASLAAPSAVAMAVTASPEASIGAMAAPTMTATAEPTRPATVVPTARLTPTPQAVTPTIQPSTGTRVYTTLPPGATLPTEQQCAGEAVRNPWEPRPENRTANQSNAWASGFRLRASYIGSILPAYEQRVTGNFTGTTDQIMRWAACKWGFDENDVRAQAVIESTWRQAHLGDCGQTTQPETNGCASMGLMQIKGANIPATHPGTWPVARTSTAFNVDYALAVRRLCFEGRETWLRKSYPTYAAGDLWGCLGRWYSGRWHDPDAERYITRLRSTLNAQPWLSPTF